MDMGGLDQASAALGGEIDPPRPVKLRTVLVALLLAAVVLLAWASWNRAQPTQRLCTLAGAIDTPEASSPSDAFEAWWATQGPEQVRYWSSSGHVAPDGIQPTRSDFTRLDDDTWEWRYDDTVSIGVDVGPPIGTTANATWAVIGVNQCTYGPFYEDHSHGT